jgi:hypothetical protein
MLIRGDVLVIPSGFRSAYSCSPVAVEGNGTAKALFPQEKEFAAPVCRLRAELRTGDEFLSETATQISWNRGGMRSLQRLSVLTLVNTVVRVA